MMNAPTAAYTTYGRLLFVYAVLFLCIYIPAYAQTLPSERSVDWTLAGLRDTTTSGFLEINMAAEGAVGDSITPNDSVLFNVLAAAVGTGIIINFESGNFLFKNTIELPRNVILRGEGANNTNLLMDLNGSGHAITIHGLPIKLDSTFLTKPAFKDSNYILVVDASNYAGGDWIKLIQQDSTLISSDWAAFTVGQIVEIEKVSGNKIVLTSPLRLDLDTANLSYIKRIEPITNVGIECLKITRIDDTAPEQASNLNFDYAVNCWVSGIESHFCTFSHIDIKNSSNIQISTSYFHHGFGYGGGGRAYGVMLNFTSNECLVENNVFQYLRHAMILQAGANGNVIAFNYSLDPYWNSFPSDASGDIVLHGNYPYFNLFEQNICRNIVIDSSHGANGPYNTFLRNRAEGFGIFFSAPSSPKQNMLGNEVTNNTSPYNLFNYTIRGSGHFIHGNNNKGTIDPPGTEVLPDLSYGYNKRPAFVAIEQWAAIGTPNVVDAASIPARDRQQSNDIFGNACKDTVIGIQDINRPTVLIYPNPISYQMQIESSDPIKKVFVLNTLGQVVHAESNPASPYCIDTKDWIDGIYLVKLDHATRLSVVKKIIKIN